MNIELLEKLCLINGTSGDESRVRDFIISEISGHCEYTVDPLGNIIAYKKGKKSAKNKVMISAHMDEVGMIVTSVKSDGTLTISPVGGVDPRVVIGRPVRVGDSGIVGVIGAKAVHNLSAEEKKTAPKFSSLYADIGAADKSAAEKLVSLGDRVHFDSDFLRFGDGFVKGKAIDDHFGCCVMIELIKSELEYDCVFTFVVQEEVGLRGSRTAAYTVDPDFALVLEATTAADIPLAAGEKRCCELGKGAVVSHMDRSTIYDRELYNISKTAASEQGIGWQTKTMVAGGNDSGAIHISRGGVRTMAISAPCRYLHSPSCTVKISDLEDCQRLAEIMIEKMCIL
ncbi:MAG: M20/M25/M40 family metallo-hydrolase [Oscillospiraceae bacterium]|nr:M20/M25/M40 family metallo-hydrolase [Oscillospiraceae bacterium]